jgi:NIMA (never in mitosis gene a)-related kinase 2
MRPSAAQLLQHERIEHAGKVAEAQRMYVNHFSFLISLWKYDESITYRLAAIKVHKANLITREREISARENALIERENHLATTLAQHESQLATTRQELSIVQQQLVTSQQHIESRIQEAVMQRERELRAAIAKREEEVAQAMSKREEEIMVAIRAREQEIEEAWKQREEMIRIEITKELEGNALKIGVEQSPEEPKNDNEDTPVASIRFRERAIASNQRSMLLFYLS